jgi:hypothetical protein
MASNPINRNAPKRTTLRAIEIIDRLGAKPLDEIYEALKFAKEMTKSGGNVSDKGVSDQASFLAAWIKSAELLAKFMYPTLSAVAVQEVGQDKDRVPMTSQQALDVIKKDPFFPKDITTEMTIKALKQADDVENPPTLPIGSNDK